MFDAREQELRRRARRFRAMTIDDRMAMPGFAYGCEADVADLLDLVSDLRRRIAHPSAGDLPAIPLAPAVAMTPATSFHVRMADPDAWNAALVAARHRVDEVIGTVIKNRGHIHDARRAVGDAITALQRAPSPIPPTEPPPFTA